MNNPAETFVLLSHLSISSEKNFSGVHMTELNGILRSARLQAIDPPFGFKALRNHLVAQYSINKKRKSLVSRKKSDKQ